MMTTGISYSAFVAGVASAGSIGSRLAGNRGAATLTVRVAEAASRLAITVAVPGPRATTFPVESTNATLVSELLQLTAEAASWRTPTVVVAIKDGVCHQFWSRLVLVGWMDRPVTEMSVKKLC